MESSTPSLVSKAKTAFHSAAAKAEKVLTDIKSDRKNDREIDGQSNKGLGKVADNETILTDISSESQEECYNESKHSRWKPMHLGKKQDWQQYLKTTKKWVEKRKKAENSDSDIPMDESLNQIDQGNICEVKSSEMGSTGEEDTPNASYMVTIPPASVIKQLAMAVEDAKKFKSMKDLLTSIRDYSTVKEKSGLSFSTMKSLVLREKEEKSTECDDDEEVISLIPFLFDAEEHFLQRKNGSDSAAIAMTSFPRDIHGAPPESFIVRLSEIIGSFKTLRNMALFWYSVVAELRRLWSEGKPVPRVPLDVNPDLSLCLLHQKLQVINCCIARKMRRDIANKSLDSVMKEASQNSDGLDVSLGHLSSILLLYARISTGDFVLRLGADHPSENLTMLETGEPVYSPITQEGQLFTEDLIRETEEFVLRTGSVGAGCSQLLSDMQAFKAANPGCILEDFVRWHSPPDWIEAVSSDETKNSFDGGDSSSRRGQLSNRMQKEGNLWRELWETAKPVPAVKQTPLFDEDMAVESILNSLEDIPPSELFEQLFVAILSSGFVVAEAALPANSGLCKLFYDCKDYVIATCQGDTSSDNIDDLCQVYQTVETILVHPDEGLKILKQSEAMTSGETKRPFKKIILNFVSRDKQVSRKAASKDQKNSDTNQGRPFSNFFDGKASLFGKKQPKPSTLPPAVPSSLDENDWTII